MAKALRLPPDELSELKNRVRSRDKNRCRVCKRSFMLHVHHIIFLSDNGSDLSSNMVTLCSSCHTKVHGKVAGDFLVIVAKDGNEQTLPNADRGIIFKRYNKVTRRIRWNKME